MPVGTKEQTAAYRRDALCSSTKIQKQAAFGIRPIGERGDELLFEFEAQIRVLLTSLHNVKHFCETMKTASVRDIRQNFPAVLRWIEEGENVAITMRRKIVARLIPEPLPIIQSALVPDFDSISKRIFGAKKFRENLVDLEREGYES